MPRIDLSSFSSAHFDRGAPRWKEASWLVVKSVFFQNPCPWPSRVRVFWLRVFGARAGEGVVIRSNVNISFPWRLSLGNHVWIGEDVGILSLAPVTIEDSVCVSQRAYLCTGSHDHRIASFDLVTKPITLCTGSWVAAQCFIAPGVTLGEGSVVSAGSVVLRSVGARRFVQGNPAADRPLDAPKG